MAIDAQSRPKNAGRKITRERPTQNIQRAAQQKAQFYK